MKKHSESNQTYEIIDGKAVAVGTGLMVAAGSALAAVPEAVTTAISGMQADAIAVATVFLVATIALTAFKFMKRGAN